MAAPVSSWPLVPRILVEFCVILLQFSVAVTRDTINASHALTVGQRVASADQAFELGFFSPGNSSGRYIGIWYRNSSPKLIVWVANRESPLAITDNSAILTVGNDGNLRLLDGKQSTVWSTNISTHVNSSSAVLSYTGDLILKDTMSGVTLWETFQDPCNVFLSTNMKLGVNTKTGEKRFLTSWKSEDDPSPGNFTLGGVPQTPLQALIWKGSAIYWRSGPWNGATFVGIEGIDGNYIENFSVEQNNQMGTVYITFNAYSNSSIYMIRLLPSGSLESIMLEDSGQWNVTWKAPASACDVYGTCGPFGVCNSNESPICKCQEGFVPKSNEEWSKGNWSSGCVRRTELLCQRNMSGNLVRSGKSDGFLTLNGMKLPNSYQFLESEDDKGCRNWCLDNCKCTAYAYVNGINCLVWTGDLIDMQKFMIIGEDLYLKLAHSELVEKKQRAALIISVTIVTIIIMFICIIMYVKCRQKAKQRADTAIFILHPVLKKMSSASYIFKDHKSKLRIDELPLFKFEKLAIATNNFEGCNMLGRGGFGLVYKILQRSNFYFGINGLALLKGYAEASFTSTGILVKKKPRAALMISLTIAAIMIMFICIVYVKYKQKAKQREMETVQIVELMAYHVLSAGYMFRDYKSKFRLDELPLFKFEKLVIATNNFEACNKLGQGGSVPFYVPGPAETAHNSEFSLISIHILSTPFSFLKSMAAPVSAWLLVPRILVEFCVILLQFSVAVTRDTINASDALAVGQRVASADQVFELGFFSPGNSSGRYIGIWYRNSSPKLIVWVANRESPLAITDNSAILTVGNDGNLRLLDGKQSTVWSTNISTHVNSSSAVLSYTGDLILKDTVSGVTLWETFQDPCNVFLSTNMKLGVNTKTGEKRFLTSWKSEDDPSPGNFTLGGVLQTPFQALIWKGSAIYWRNGPWNGATFVGIEGIDGNYIGNFSVQQNNQMGTVYITFNAA
ncbi:hypothetical protein Ancab_005080 [Ancistrocladus abbreviatus]